jgi:hypothetical protein
MISIFVIKVKISIVKNYYSRKDYKKKNSENKPEFL